MWEDHVPYVLGNSEILITMFLSIILQTGLCIWLKLQQLVEKYGFISLFNRQKNAILLVIFGYIYICALTALL